MLHSLFYYLLVLWAFTVQASFLGTAADLRETYTDDLKYDEVTYLTTHNSFTIQTEDWLYRQQSLSFDNQFKYGVWSFMLDLHWCPEDMRKSQTISLAHLRQGSSNTRNYSDSRNHQYLLSCRDSRAQKSQTKHRSFESFFNDYVKKWLDHDDKSIITLHLESYLGTDGAAQLRRVFEQVGILHYIYGDLSQKSWPTFGEMRMTNKRLVVFSSNSGDCGLGDVFSTVRYRETQYDLETAKNCERRFDDRNRLNDTALLLLNHFYSTSFETRKLTYHQVNNPYADRMQHKYEGVKCPVLSVRTRLCVQQESIYPTFVAVDFVEEGDVGGAREWVLYLNRLRQMRREEPSLPLDFFPSDLVSQEFSDSSSEVVDVEDLMVMDRAIWTALFKLANPVLHATSSIAFALSSYQYPWMVHPASLLGTLALVSWWESWTGYYIPARFSSALNTLATIPFYQLLVRYHPGYWFVWLEKNVVRPLIHARISGKKRR